MKNKTQKIVGDAITHLYKYRKNHYITDIKDIATCDEKIIDFPIIFDTEFQSPDMTHRISENSLLIGGKEITCPINRRNRIPITAQIATITDEIGKIYAYPELQKIAIENDLGTVRHELLPEKSFIPLEYLKTKLSDIQYILASDNKKYEKTLVISVIGFFLTAEIGLMTTGDYTKEIKRIINSKDFKATKRLSTGGKYTDYVKTKFVVSWKQNFYNVALRLIDLAAIHGIASYAEIAKNVGHELQYKDNFTTNEKSEMLHTYFSQPERFDEYALGDLDCYQILLKNAQMKEKIYSDLNIKEYCTPPKLTIGSEVSQLLESVVLKRFNLNKENFKDSPIYKYILEIEKVEKLSFNKLKNKFFEIFGHTNTQLLANRLDTGCLLAKVVGGRCYNNRNTERHIKSIMIDLDIAGCYGNGLTNQEYPFGFPKFLSNELDKKVKQLTLKEFLNRYKDELIPGLWSAVISTTNDLEYPQDFFPSWIDWKREDHEIKVKTGITKIFQKSIKNGVLTSDGLEFIEYVMSNKQRLDFYKKTIVNTAVIYPKSTRLNSIEELIEKPFGENYWMSINMGDLVIKKLLSERKKHPKGSPLNTLFKLMVNTTYGDIVSPYFKISNAMVGNNITARARALCYYMEKGLHGFQSITDGVCFEVEKVVYPPKREKYVNAVELYTNKNTRFDKLFDGNELSEKYIHLKNNPQLKDEKNKFDLYINVKCFEHLKTIFNPEISIFKYNQFSFEYKEIVKEATFMGSSDYKFTYLDGKEKIKKRSYSERKMKHKITKIENEWIKIDNYPDGNIPNKIMNDLKSNLIEINPPGLQFQILKVNEYKNNRQKYDVLNLLPGDTVPKITIPKTISVSQIKYDNENDYKTIKKHNEKLIRKNHIGIGELLFKNGKVKYNPDFFKNPFKYITENDISAYNPYKELINEIKEMMEKLKVTESVENENCDNFDFFDDDDETVEIEAETVESIFEEWDF